MAKKSEWELSVEIEASKLAIIRSTLDLSNATFHTSERLWRGAKKFNAMTRAEKALKRLWFG